MLGATGIRRFGDLWYDFAHEQGTAVLLVSIIYLGTVTIARWRLIASPFRSALRGDLRDLVARLQMLPIDRQERDEIEALLAGIESDLLDPNSAHDRLLWGRGYEGEAENRMRAAERLFCRYLPEPEVDARLALARANLGTSTEPACVALAASITSALTSENAAPSIAVRRSLLELTIGLDSNVSYAPDLAWHRKSIWLLATGLTFATVAAYTFDHAQLLFLGAFGAFLSRVWRAVSSKKTPRAYWAFWYTLFLAPLAGAFAAFGGILLIEVLRTTDLLGDAFDEVGWSHPKAPATLGLAFLLGFSERLLDTLAKRGETAVTPTEPTPPPPPTQPGTTTPGTGIGTPEPQQNSSGAVLEQGSDGVELQQLDDTTEADQADHADNGPPAT